MGAQAAHLGRPRWDGRPGRVEVWYATLTDADGTGYWVHYETVAPDTGPAYGHGWAAVFPTDGAPVVERFGPDAVAPSAAAWFDCAGAGIADGRLTGNAGGLRWDLSFADDSPPLYTFPELTWRRELLPGCQIVPWPRARFTGTFGDRTVDAIGAVARIFGHGNAKRWGWLHADLGGGDLLEIVSAVSRRPGLDRLPPLAMVRLRLAGEPDWPRSSIAASPRFRTSLGLPQWTVRGAAGGRRLSVRVTLPSDRCVALTYTDPDGATATCTNSERADAEVFVERRASSRWTLERQWTLEATAHAEVGLRP